MNLLPLDERGAWKVKDIVKFIRARRIDSFQKLGVLAFLYQNAESSWTSQEIAEQLYLGDVPLLEEILADLRSAFRCDAVMFGSVTGFEPYPDARLALRLWLIDLRSGKLLWGVDHAWQVSEPATAEKMRHYYDAACGAAGDDAVRLAQMSPRAFGEFVAWDLARALPLPPGAAEPAPHRSTSDRVRDAARNICTN